MEKLHNTPKDELGVVDHPKSLFQNSTPTVIRESLPRAPERAFLLHNVLTKDECDHYVKATERTGYRSLEKSFPSGYRSNDRIINLDLNAAEALFKRIVPHLVADDCRVTPMGPLGEGVWIPYSLNEGLKFCRYRPGCKFLPHIDGPWTPESHLHSIYTVVFYLNDDFTGGETNFLKDLPQDRQKQLSELEQASVRRDVCCTTAPKTGSALVFKHEICHEGAELKTGMKYILRTEVVFRRLPSVLDSAALGTLRNSPVMKEIQELYRRSEQHTEQGDSKKTEFVEEYLKALRLQSEFTKLKESATSPSAMPLLYGRVPRDVLLIIFEHVRLVDLLRLMQCSRPFYRLARDPELWRRRFQREYPKKWTTEQNQTLSINWFGQYRAQYFESIKSENPKMILQIGPEYTVVGVSLSDQSVRTLVPEFKCPYCPLQLSEYALVTRCNQAHQTESPRVVCPICAARPGGDPKFVSSHFFAHLKLKHSGHAANYAVCTSFKRAIHSLISHYVLHIPGYGHGGYREDDIFQTRDLFALNTQPSEFVAPVPMMDQCYRYVTVHPVCEKARIITEEKKALVLNRAAFDALTNFLRPHQVSRIRKAVLICPDVGFPASMQAALHQCSVNLGDTTVLVPFSPMALRIHGLISGLVVCLDSKESGFMTLVIDSRPVRHLPIHSAEVIAHMPKLALLIREFIRDEERETAGYFVALTGLLVAKERRLYDAQCSLFVAQTKLEKTATSGVGSAASGVSHVQMAPISEKEKQKQEKEEKKRKEKEEKDRKEKEKKDNKHKQPASAPSYVDPNPPLGDNPPAVPSTLPNPRYLFPNRLEDSLHQLNPAYRVLCSLEPIFDAVEGAARAACVVETNEFPTLVKLETLLHDIDKKK